jgi:Zn-finger nucleic acid-binding protein
MKCPTCKDTNLVMSDRQGVEIDYCPQCRGVWLDRGELDKIVERASGGNPTFAAPPTKAYKHDDDWDDDDRYKVRYDKHGRPYKKSKTKSFLGEILDF